MMNNKLRDRLRIRMRDKARMKIDELEGRDECLNCGATSAIEVHHIDGDWLNNHPMNLVPICHQCHRRAHRVKRASSRMQEMKEDLRDISN